MKKTRKLRVTWQPKIEQDLDYMVAFKMITQEEADKLLKEFKNE